MKIFLSGGFKSNWQERVIMLTDEHEFIDPSRHGLERENEYTFWDLAGVEVADLVFAYLEPSNPKPFGLCVEVGYAAALGKKIIVVDEMGTPNLGMVRACAHVVVPTLNDGIKLLNSLAKQ